MEIGRQFFLHCFFHRYFDNLIQFQSFENSIQNSTYEDIFEEISKVRFITFNLTRSE